MAKANKTKRLLNVGKEIELKQLGRVTVRELSLEGIVRLSTDIQKLYKELGGEVSGVKILKMFQGGKLNESLFKVAAASTDRQIDDFKEMGISDWLKLVAAIKEVWEWDELRETFFQLTGERAVPE